MNKSKIVLYNPLPRRKEDVQDNFIITPMSLLAVSSLLDQAGYKVVIVDAAVDADYEEKVLREAGDAVYLGITMITGHQIENAISMVKRLRANSIKTPVVVGGYHASIFPEQTAASDVVDYVCYGQGQRTALELAEALQGAQEMNDIRGLVYKKNGRVVMNPAREFENINNFPATPYHLIEIDKYIYDNVASGFGARTCAIYTSQGCPWKCGFCAENKVTHHKWSGFSAERVADEIEFLVTRHGVDSILIYDTNFVVDRRRLRDIFLGLKRRSITVPFGFVNARADWITAFDDELWEAVRPYIQDVLIGAEAGDDRLLNFINKGITVDDLYRAKKVLHTQEITAGYSFMIGLPLPVEWGVTPGREFAAILDVVAGIDAVDNNNNIRMFSYTPYPGTPLFDQAVARGLKAPDSLEGWSEWDNERANVPWLDAKYSLILNQMNRYILPYMSRQYDDFWEKRYRGKARTMKRLIHSFFKVMARWRFNHRFFSFPFEYYFLIWMRRRKQRRRAQFSPESTAI